jgi:hypothetical protein
MPSPGALTEPAAFEAVFAFLLAETEGWKMDPLQTQFSDNIFGPKGEIRHTTYGEGTLRVSPLVVAAHRAGVDMVMISESRDDASHRAIQAELEEALAGLEVETGTPVSTRVTSLPTGRGDLPAGGRYRLVNTPRPLLLSNIDKPYFPDGTTKGDLIQYYASVADVLLPHLSGRPISMSRYPDGIDGPSFYEKRAPGHQPDWMKTATVPSDSMGGDIDFLLAADRESLMWFANMGCIEVHPFHSRAEHLEYPDYAIFDFDPAEGSNWDQVVAGTRLLGQALQGLGLDRIPQTVRLPRHARVRTARPGPHLRAGARIRRRRRQAARRRQPRRHHHGDEHPQTHGKGVRRRQPELLRPDGRLRVLGPSPPRRPRLGPHHLGRSRHHRQRRHHHPQPSSTGSKPMATCSNRSSSATRRLDSAEGALGLI